MRKKRTWTALFAAWLICGCATIQQQLIDRPEMEYQGVAFETATFFEATPVFTFRLTNSNPRVLNIHKVAYTLKINGKKFIKGFSDRVVPVKPKGEGFLNLPVNFHFLDLFASVSDYSERKKLHYELSGSIHVGPYTLPFMTEGEFSSPEPPRLNLKNVRIEKISKQEASLRFRVDLENGNPFPVTVETLNYRIGLGDSYQDNGRLESVGKIIAMGSVSRNIRLVIRSDNPVYAMLQADEPSVRYDLDMEIFIRSGTYRPAAYPVRQTGKIMLHPSSAPQNG